MKQHLLENGLKAVADYYLGCSKHVQASYERACRVVRKFYGEFGFEEYNPAHDDEIMNQVLAGRTLTPESSYMFCRYVFRVLEMMKDYFAGRPFRKKYPMFSRYKFELEPEYLNFTNEFRDWLKLEPQTILGLYSIARDFAYYLQQNGLHDFSAIDQETLYSFMTWEYETHPATLDRVGYSSPDIQFSMFTRRFFSSRMYTGENWHLNNPAHPNYFQFFSGCVFSAHEWPAERPQASVRIPFRSGF